MDFSAGVVWKVNVNVLKPWLSVRIVVNLVVLQMSSSAKTTVFIATFQAFRLPEFDTMQQCIFRRVLLNTTWRVTDHYGQFSTNARTDAGQTHDDKFVWRPFPVCFHSGRCVKPRPCKWVSNSNVTVWILECISFACVQCGSLTNPFISESVHVWVCVCLFVWDHT